MGNYGMKQCETAQRRVHADCVFAVAVAAVGDRDRADDDGQHRGKVGGTDLQNDLAYHAAEGGIEKIIPI